VGEILGVSKELARLLAESIKPKISNRKGIELRNDLPVRNGFVAEGFRVMEISEGRTKEPLIELPITILGNNLKAVIDTGSKLNIVSERIYEQFVSLPINWSKTLILEDANGGKGDLKGLVSQVPVFIGSVLTIVEMYVGKRMPFDILLGRPWQIHNVVSIHERPTGMWLEFGNSPTNDQVSEVLVVPSKNRRSHENGAKSWQITCAESSGTEEPDQEALKNSITTSDAVALALPDKANHEDCRHILKKIQYSIVDQVSKMVNNCVDLINSTIQSIDSTTMGKSIKEEGK